MKNKHIIKDILRNYPELEKDKKTLQKTVEFLMVSQPKVQIDQKFKSHLWEKLSTLAVMKSWSVESFVKKPLLLHVFGWVFASLLAFFWLFYVFGDGLFYTWSTPQISEYEAQISDIDTVQETKLEIRSTGWISEPTEETSIPNTQVEQKVPNTIIINQDGALQIDVSEKQQLKILPVEESTTDRSQDIVSDDVPQDIIPNQESNLDFADAIWWADTPDVSNGTMIMDQIWIFTRSYRRRYSWSPVRIYRRVYSSLWCIWMRSFYQRWYQSL